MRFCEKKFFDFFYQWSIPYEICGRGFIAIRREGAGYTLIAVNMVRSPCVDDVCRKVYQNAPFLLSYFCNYFIFKDVCDRYTCLQTHRAVLLYVCV